MVNVLPLAMDILVVMVIVLPDAAAAHKHVPFTVKLFKVIVGTAVIFADWSAGIITSSPPAGAPFGLQFAAVVHAPPAVGTHDFVAAVIPIVLMSMSIINDSVAFLILPPRK